MIPQNNKKNPVSRTLAIAAICFFAPIIQQQIKKNDFNLNTEEKGFVQSYIQYGYISLTILIILIVTSILKSSKNRQRLASINSIILILILTIVIGGIIAAISGKILIKTERQETNIDNNQKENRQQKSLLYYLPIYNQYARHNESHNEIIQESILRRTIICITTIIDPSNISSIILITVVIMRAIMQTLEIEVRSLKTQQRMNMLFTKCPNELTAYPIAGMQRLIEKLHKRKPVLTSIVQQWKDHYQQKYANSNIARTQYGFMIIISRTIMLSYITRLNLNPEYSIDILVRAIISGNFITSLLTKQTYIIPIVKEGRSYLEHFVISKIG